jgi:hypothetical protein
LGDVRGEERKDIERKRPVARRTDCSKEVVTTTLHSVLGLAHEEEESVEMKVGKLAKAIQ